MLVKVVWQNGLNMFPTKLTEQNKLNDTKWVFSDVGTCFFTNVVCLNTYDIYGVKVAYNAQFFTRIPNP